VRGIVISWLIFPYPYIICIRFYFKTLALWVRLLGGLLGYYLNILAVSYDLKRLNKYRLRVFIGSIWFIPYLRTKGVSLRVLDYSQKLKTLLDKGWRELYGGQGIYQYVFTKRRLLEIAQSNIIKVFIILFITFILILLIISL
jgi:NADH-ubiquinone oxidoreductase chain 5